MSELRMRKAIVAAMRELDEQGLNQATTGNIAVRHGQHMLITPSGVRSCDQTAEAIARMAIADPSGAFTGPLPPSSEWRLHFEILRARSDVNAVVHTHSPYATTLSTLRREIPAVHYMVAAFGGAKIGCAGYATFGTRELAELAVTGLGDNHGVLLSNHGAVVTGANLARAMWRAIGLEALAKVYFLATLAGEPTILSDEEIAHLVRRFDTYGPQNDGE